MRTILPDKGRELNRIPGRGRSVSKDTGVQQQGDGGEQRQGWSDWSPFLEEAWVRGREAGDEAVLDLVRAGVSQLWPIDQIQLLPVFVNEVSVE